MRLILGIIVLVVLAMVPLLAADPGGPEITIGTGGDMVYARGEIISFSGTNTAGPTTYIFVTAPDLPEGGVNPGNFTLPAESGTSSTFMEVAVSDDSSYGAAWDPAGAAPGGAPAGSYTIYASAAPVNFSDLAETPFASVTIFLLEWPSSIPLPTPSAQVTIPPPQLPVTIPPTQEPFPLPTASDPSGTPITIPPTQEPFPLPTASDPSGTQITIPPTRTPVPIPTGTAPSEPQVPIPPTQEPLPLPTATDSGTQVTIPPTATPIPLPSAPVPFPLPPASGSKWQFPINASGFENWQNWLIDQLRDLLTP